MTAVESSGAAGAGGYRAVAVSLLDQAAAVEREIRMREKLYPRWVRDGKLTQKLADLELERMRAVLNTVRSGAGADTAFCRKLIRSTEERVIDIFTPFVHSSKILKIEQRLWPEVYCMRCEKIQPAIDRGTTCAVCKLVQ